MRRRAADVAAAVVAAAVALHGSFGYAQYTPRLREGHEAGESGEVVRARTIFTEASRSDDLGEAALARYFLAQLDDDAMDFAAALSGYRDFLARDPGSRWAARATARVEELASHGEGGFAPLRALESVRRDPARSEDVTALRELSRAADGFPSGPVRAEARTLVGEAWLRMRRPRAATEVLEKVLVDPAAPQTLRDLAAQHIVEARAMVGEEDTALAEVTAAPRVAPEVLAEARVLARRVVLRRVAWRVLGATALLGAAGVAAVLRAGGARALARAWWRPVPLAAIVMFTLGGAGLARLSDGHEGGPFYLLCAGALGVYLAAAAWRGAAQGSAAARALGAALSLAAVLAVSYLAMLTLDPMMLEGISL